MLKTQEKIQLKSKQGSSNPAEVSGPKEATFAELCSLFVVIAAASWCVMYFLPAGPLYTVFLPTSFFTLFGVVLFSPLVAGGWPFAPPFGSWKPGESVLKPGLGTVALLALVTLAGGLFVTQVYPKIPLFPVGLWFGLILFGVTLLYVLVWNCWPLSPQASPPVRLVTTAVVILVVTGLLWQLVNLTDTPFAGQGFDPQGPFQVMWFFGCLVWVIVWLQMFATVLTFQQWPFYKLGQPLSQIVTTAVIIPLGYFCWTILLKAFGPDVAVVIGGGIIGAQLIHGVMFGFFPFLKHKQPVRGIYNLLLELGFAGVWIVVCRVLMKPVVEKVTAAGVLPPPMATVETFTVLYTLHFVAIVMLIHGFFFLRAPLSPAGPPPSPE